MGLTSMIKIMWVYKSWFRRSPEVICLCDISGWKDSALTGKCGDSDLPDYLVTIAKAHFFSIDIIDELVCVVKMRNCDQFKMSCYLSSQWHHWSSYCILFLLHYYLYLQNWLPYNNYWFNICESNTQYCHHNLCESLYQYNSSDLGWFREGDSVCGS